MHTGGAIVKFFSKTGERMHTGGGCAVQAEGVPYRLKVCITR